MRRLLLATLGGALAIAAGAGNAAADAGGDAAQVAGQAALSGQAAGALSGASQYLPSNHSIAVRVLSPGNGGSVNQSNTATAQSVAGNGNDTSQSTTQSQAGGGPGSDYVQSAGQAAQNDQSADASAGATQTQPSNESISVRVLSPGDDGSVSQSNDVAAGAAALNGNSTSQSVGQNQTSGGPGGLYLQAAGQAAGNLQDADAEALSEQCGAENANTPVRVLSPGGNGSVWQSNTSAAQAVAANGNETGQDVSQSQTGGGIGALYIQAAGQLAGSSQEADAEAEASQRGATNENAPVRVWSPGTDGSISQSNAVGASAAALNGNWTMQSIVQGQVGGGYGALYLQAAGQEAMSWQIADSLAHAVQGVMPMP